jgi:two-component system chemotaxis response regulator CheB
MGSIRVIVIDDSKVMRDIITSSLNSDPGIQVVGEAENPLIARDMIKKLKPDVLTLDIEMPKMNGIAFLKNLMRLHPMPVVMVSTLTEKGSEITMRSLELGAVDYVLKPSVNSKTALEEYSKEIIEKVKNAAETSVMHINANRPIKRMEGSDALSDKDKFIVIGASTGGVEAVPQVLAGLPNSLPPVFIIQHLSDQFVGRFVEQLQQKVNIPVINIQGPQKVLPNHIYVSASKYPIEILKLGTEFEIHCAEEDEEKIDHIDHFFESVAKQFGDRTIAILMTGMGQDGAKGLKEIKEAGGDTAVQDQETSMIWGMPGKAIELGATETQLPLHRIAEFILKKLMK